MESRGRCEKEGDARQKYGLEESSRPLIVCQGGVMAWVVQLSGISSSEPSLSLVPHPAAIRACGGPSEKTDKCPRPKVGESGAFGIKRLKSRKSSL